MERGGNVHNRWILFALLVALASALGAPSIFWQVPQPSAAAASVQNLSPEVVDNLLASARPDSPATLTIANRDIVVVRAALVGRTSAARVRAA